MTTGAVTPVASCTVGSTQLATSPFTTTTCTQTNTAATNAACTVGTTTLATSPFTISTCTTTTTTSNTQTGVAPCVTDGTTTNGTGQTQTCATSVVTATAPIASCTAGSTFSAGTGNTTTCTVTTSAATPIALCTVGTTSLATSPFTTTACANPIHTVNVPVQTCTAGTDPVTLVKTTCTFPAANNTSNVPIASCSPQTGTSGNNWITKTCPTPVTTGPTAVQTCSSVQACGGAGSCGGVNNSFTATSCNTATTSNVLVPVCAPQTAAAGNNFLAITCNTTNVSVPGKQLMFTVDTTVTTTSKSGNVLLSQAGPTTTTSSATSVNNQCFADPSQTATLPPFNPTLASPPATAAQVAANNAVAPYPYATLPASEPPSVTAIAGLAAPLPAGCTTWVGGCITSTPLPQGAANTLADVAQYYYNTDLRTAGSNPIGGPLAGNKPGIDVTFNNVRKGAGTFPEDDVAVWQHMTTFTMGLGLSGTRNYSPTYKTDTTGDFAAIRSGSLNWPIPIAGQASALDDLWHAAVNGRGEYFSASDPDSVVASLSTALAAVSTRRFRGGGGGDLQPRTDRGRQLRLHGELLARQLVRGPASQADRPDHRDYFRHPDLVGGDPARRQRRSRLRLPQDLSVSAKAPAATA